MPLIAILISICSAKRTTLVGVGDGVGSVKKGAATAAAAATGQLSRVLNHVSALRQCFLPLNVRPGDTCPASLRLYIIFIFLYW